MNIFSDIRNFDISSVQNHIRDDSYRNCGIKYQGFTPFLYAIYYSNYEIAVLLMNREEMALYNENDFNKNALHYACASGNIAIFCLIMENAGDDIDLMQRDLNGSTALHFACFSGNIEMVSTLLTQNFKFKDTDRLGKNALSYACENNQLEMVNFILHKTRFNRSLINAMDIYRRMPIHYTRNIIIFDLILTSQNDLFHTDEDEQTYLHYAVKVNCINIIDYLQRKGLDFNAKNIYGQESIHMSITVQMTELLFKFGAQLNNKDHVGRTPLHIACKRSFPNIVDFLLKYIHIANALIYDRNKISPFKSALENSSIELLQLLFNRGIRITFDNTEIQWYFNRSKFLINSTQQFKIHKLLAHHMAIQNENDLHAFLHSSTFEHCKFFFQELLKMKQIKIREDVHLSFFDFLKCSVSECVDYLNQYEHIWESLFGVNRSFPIYCYDLINKIKSAIIHTEYVKERFNVCKGIADQRLAKSFSVIASNEEIDNMEKTTSFVDALYYIYSPKWN